MNHKPRLWITPAQLPALREETKTGTKKILLDRALEIAGMTTEQLLNHPDITNHLHPEGQCRSLQLQSASIAHLITGESKYAQLALSCIPPIMGNFNTSDLGRAGQVIQLAVAFDWCASAWPEDKIREIAQWFVKMAISFQPENIGKGNPDNPFNNWYGVTHANAGLAAMSARGYATGAEEIIELSRERIRSYLMNYGDQGHYYEGTGYGGYSMAMWAPFVLASKFADGVDLLEYSPGLRNLPATVASMVVNRPKRLDSLEDMAPNKKNTIGMRIHWNDDGGGFGGSGDVPHMFAIAPPEQLGALRWIYDHTCGIHGSQTFSPEYSALPWDLLYYPQQIPTQHPNETLPKTRFDQKNGLCIIRNQYKDANDIVFGAYAKAYHPGGHAHTDAGSFRLMGLGELWAMAGGQNKLHPIYQCLPIRDFGGPLEAPGKPAQNKGYVSYLTLKENGQGGAINLRMANAYHGSKIMDRHFAIDYSGKAGVPALLANLDQIWDENNCSWSWTMCYDPTLDLEISQPTNTFILKSKQSDARCTIRFLSPQKLTLSTHAGQPSQRTYSGGTIKNYPAMPSLLATTQPTDKVDFFTIITLSHGEAPPIQTEGQGANITATIGQARIYFQQGKWYHGPLRIV